MANPRTRYLHRLSFDQEALIGLPAQEHHCSLLITEPTVVIDADTQRVVLAYLHLEDELRDLAPTLVEVPTAKHTRLSGLKTNAAHFGYEPRNPRHQGYCTAALMKLNHPAAHALLSHAAHTIAQQYAWYDPDRYARHQQETARVLPEWRLEETAFTSGVLNRDWAMAYHLDAGNVAGTWSGMLGFRQAMDGGHLAIPAYDLALEIADCSLTLFEGSTLVHGVTPLQPRGDNAYRITAVYYARQRMWQCLTNAEEVAEFQRWRTEQERLRAGLPPE